MREYRNGEPLLTFVVVQKRNHLRTAIGSENPPPGTVILNKITDENTKCNMYVYSHKAIAGTARPVHYQVTFFTKEEICDTLLGSL
jgi:hypothetical protein